MIKNEKYIELIKYFKGLGKVVLVFLGGVDSIFLFKVGKEVFGDNLKVVIIMLLYILKWEIVEVEEFVKELGVEYEIIKVLIIDLIRYNLEDRCYFCKIVVFNMILDLVKK